MNLDCSYIFVLNQPYGQARNKIQAALKQRGLVVAFDLDVAKDIRRSAGVQLPKSSILGVGCPYQFLEALVADAAAAVFFPIHVFVCEHGQETQVCILASQCLRSAGVSPAISIPVHRTLRRIGEALVSAGAYSAKNVHDGMPGNFEIAPLMRPGCFKKGSCALKGTLGAWA